MRVKIIWLFFVMVLGIIFSLAKTDSYVLAKEVCWEECDEPDGSKCTGSGDCCHEVCECYPSCNGDCGGSDGCGGHCDHGDEGILITPFGACSQPCGGGERCGEYICEGWVCEPCNTQPCCTPTDPAAFSLSGPADGVQFEVGTVTFSWTIPSAWGTGCPENNNQILVYADTSSSPTTLVETLGPTVTSYEYTASGNERIYWRIVASNGSNTTSSETRSFYSPGTLTGTLFDASDVDDCTTLAVQPKVTGGVVTIDGVTDYIANSDGVGIYTRLVKTPDSYLLSVVPGSAYIEVPKLVCQGTTADFVNGAGAIVTRDFGFWRIYGGWWQVTGGDVYGSSGIESVIPASMPVEDQYLIKQDSNGMDGLAYYGSGEIDLGTAPEAQISDSGWQAETGYGGQDFSYAYYMAKMDGLEMNVWDGSGKPVFIGSEGDYDIYTYEGNATISGFNVDKGEKYILMINGDVRVGGNVTVSLGGHLTVIASGDITFIPGITEVHGWWVGDSIEIASIGDTSSENTFHGEGSFVGWDGFDFGRDRGVLNNTEPTETFEFRPDLVVNAPGALKLSRYLWQELSP